MEQEYRTYKDLTLGVSYEKRTTGWVVSIYKATDTPTHKNGDYAPSGLCMAVTPDGDFTENMDDGDLISRARFFFTPEGVENYAIALHENVMFKSEFEAFCHIFKDIEIKAKEKLLVNEKSL